MRKGLDLRHGVLDIPQGEPQSVGLHPRRMIGVLGARLSSGSAVQEAAIMTVYRLAVRNLYLSQLVQIRRWLLYCGSPYRGMGKPTSASKNCRDADF
jgi:hypothetical protein